MIKLNEGKREIKGKEGDGSELRRRNGMGGKGKRDDNVLEDSEKKATTEKVKEYREKEKKGKKKKKKENILVDMRRE